MKQEKIIKWAKVHGKNPNAILRMYKKMNAIEKVMFNEEINNERNAQHQRPA